MMRNTIELFDTTLRDGSQAEHVTLSVSDKMRIAHRLDAFGIHVIEGGWPGSNPKDQEFFEEAAAASWLQARICAFGSTRRAGNAPEHDPNLLAMLASGTGVVSIFGKSWTLHVERALGVSLAENLDMIGTSVAYIAARGRRVIYDAEHFFDGYRDNPAYALKTLDAAAEAGADVLVLCDTNGGTLPSDVGRIVRAVRQRFDSVGIHAHNDSGCGVANALAAVESGARHVQGTINGIGERVGNTDLCTVVACLQTKMGYECVPPECLRGLADLSHFVDEVANLLPLDRAPFVGRSAFAHKGGIHVSAVMKEPRAYEHLPPEVVGNKRRVLVSDLSGQSNVRYKAKELGIELNGNTETREAVKRIKALEHLGYEYQGAEASFELLLRSIRGEETKMFALDRFRVHTARGQRGVQWSEATVAVFVRGKRELAVAEGVGPVDALSNALHKALCRSYPRLAAVRLADYKVRVLGSESATEALVRVLIEHHEAGGERRWHTVGVSKNILDASWQALTDGISYYLFHTEPDRLVATGLKTVQATAA